MVISLSDAHCHLDFENVSDFSKLGESVCVNACYPSDWEVLRAFDGVKKSFGLHPNFCRGDKSLDEIFAELEKYFPFADAIGETGLDESVQSRVSSEEQNKIFERQIDYALFLSLPLVIHCVGRWGAVLKTLEEKNFKANSRGFLIHAAKCSPELVERFEKIGGRFSFGLRELSSAKGVSCARAVSDDRILIESDGLPSAKTLSDTLEKLAEIRGDDEENLSALISTNFEEFYSK